MRARQNIAYLLMIKSSILLLINKLVILKLQLPGCVLPYLKKTKTTLETTGTKRNLWKYGSIITVPGSWLNMENTHTALRFMKPEINFISQHTIPTGAHSLLILMVKSSSGSLLKRGAKAVLHSDSAPTEITTHFTGKTIISPTP